MDNTYDEQDEDMDDLEADGAEEGAEAAEADDDESEPRNGKEAAPKNPEDNPDERSVSSRQSLRDEMDRQIQEFLSRGGKIQEIDPNVTADPPRKPESDYGSRPI